MANPFTIVKSSPTVSTSAYSLVTSSTSGVPGTSSTGARKVTATVDLALLAAGDQFDLVVYEGANVAGGSSQRELDRCSFAGKSGPLEQRGPWDLAEGWDVVIIKVAGLDRVIPVSLRMDVGDANLVTWLGAAPNALTAGRNDSLVGAYASGLAPLQPTVAGRTLDVSAGGEAGLDLANVGSPTTTLNLSGTTVKNATDVKTVVDAIATYVDTEVAAIKAKTDNLPSDPASAGTVASSFATVNGALATIAGYIDTEIASILSALSGLPTAAMIADAFFTARIEGTETFVQFVRQARAVLYGNASLDEATGAFSFLGLDGITARVVGSIVAGVRTFTTRNGS